MGVREHSNSTASQRVVRGRLGNLDTRTSTRTLVFAF